MLQRTDLGHFLQELFQYDKFEDYCQNGLQVEGKDEIQKIIFGVSFNLPFLEQAIQQRADAIIVHHGIFGKNFFSLKGVMKEKIKLLLEHEISLFGIHLPMDAHKPYGNNAQLFSYLGVELIEAFDVGFIGENRQQHSLTQMLEIFHQKLQPQGFQFQSVEQPVASVLMPKQQYGFLYFDNGPEVPEKIAIISGGSARTYRSAELLETGVDTYICGSVEEVTSAFSYETKTNFANIGHYWSEKSGPLALKAKIEQQFDVETIFIELENII